MGPKKLGTHFSRILGWAV